MIISKRAIAIVRKLRRGAVALLAAALWLAAPVGHAQDSGFGIWRTAQTVACTVTCFVRQATGQTFTAGATSFTASLTTTTGDDVFGEVLLLASGTGLSLTSVSTNQSQTASVGTSGPNGNNTCYPFYLHNVAAGTTTWTFNLVNGSADLSGGEALLNEFQPSTSGTVDASKCVYTLDGTAGTHVFASITTTATDHIVASGQQSQGNPYTADAGYALHTNNASGWSSEDEAGVASGAQTPGFKTTGSSSFDNYDSAIAVKP